MKANRIFLGLAALFVSMTVTSIAKADVLHCWNTYYKTKSQPVFTATIVADNELKDVTLINKKTVFKDLSVPPTRMIGSEITTSRSRYKGNNEYNFNEERLILPAKLDAANLIEKEKTGIGMGPKENGVLIGSFDGDGAGSHFSVRLRCRAYTK